MKINAGNLKNKKIQIVPKTSEKIVSSWIRVNIFNLINNFFLKKKNLKKNIVVDPFVGSGSLVFEAISRGFKKAYVNDKDINFFKYIKKNIKQLSINKDQILVFKTDYLIFLRYLKKQFLINNIKIDLFFLNPPIKLVNNCHKIADFFFKNNLFYEATLIITLNWKKNIVLSKNFEELVAKRYGKMMVSIFKLKNV